MRKLIYNEKFYKSVLQKLKQRESIITLSLFLVKNSLPKFAKKKEIVWKGRTSMKRKE